MTHKSKNHKVSLILDNIRSVFNVGSIFRTAETLGIGKIYCIGTTPTPLDRFGRKRKDFAKVSLGAEEIVEWEYIGKGGATLHESTTGEQGIEEAVKMIKKLKKDGCKIISLEQSPKSVDYKSIEMLDISSRPPRGSVGKNLEVAIILGNEVDGVSSDLLKVSDIIAEIPMLGKKESLNVAVAGAIFLFRLLDK
jgi:tRNA G18 (ribose-2'-O)-methylase SpoU